MVESQYFKGAFNPQSQILSCRGKGLEFNLRKFHYLTFKDQKLDIKSKRWDWAKTFDLDLDLRGKNTLNNEIEGRPLLILPELHRAFQFAFEVIDPKTLYSLSIEFWLLFKNKACKALARGRRTR